MTNHLHHIRERQQSEPPSVVALVKAGHPTRAMILSMFWRMPWRTVAAIIGLGVGVKLPSGLGWW